MYVLGIDVGTQGARAVLCDAHGQIIAQATAALARPALPTPHSNWFEQAPADWWDATCNCLHQVAEALRQQNISPTQIAGIAIASTSGTLCAVDADGVPLGNAIMYNDRRAEAEAQEVNASGQSLAAKLGYRFSASYGLPKALWLKRHQPARFAATHYLLSPADWLSGMLTGRFGITDYSNALKMGYDLIDERWPIFIANDLGLPLDRLPHVVAPGTTIGALSQSSATRSGLAAGIPILAGMTDGCASQFSTGAVAPGQWSSTLGTTMVIKGVNRALIRDPLGRVYCHRHPDGYWLPGGASNVGGDCLTAHFSRTEWEGLNALALERAPTEMIIYPLQKRGERFPFVHPQAEGFILGEPADNASLYTAYLEGVALTERLAYDTLAELGADMGDQIHVAGGANQSHAWLQIRADVLNKTLRVPTAGGAAMGAAIVAASTILYPGVIPAAQAMVHITSEIAPRPHFVDLYHNKYQQFVVACQERGYIGG